MAGADGRFGSGAGPLLHCPLGVAVAEYIRGRRRGAVMSGGWVLVGWVVVVGQPLAVLVAVIVWPTD